jgi:hypothetical protein
MPNRPKGDERPGQQPNKDDFESLARRLECDEDRGRFEAKLRKLATTEAATMSAEDISYNGGRIEVRRQGAGWKAAVFKPGSRLQEEKTPSGSDRQAVIDEAKRIIDTP